MNLVATAHSLRALGNHFRIPTPPNQTKVSLKSLAAREQSHSCSVHHALRHLVETAAAGGKEAEELQQVQVSFFFLQTKRQNWIRVTTAAEPSHPSMALKDQNRTRGPVRSLRFTPSMNFRPLWMLVLVRTSKLGELRDESLLGKVREVLDG